MSIFGQRHLSRARKMNAKSTARLQLECLETRSLLSAMALQLVPPLGPPPAPAVLAEMNPAGADSVDIPSATRHGVQSASLELAASTFSTPNQLSAGLFAAPYPRLPTGGQLGDRAIFQDLNPIEEITNLPVIFPVTQFEAGSSLAESSSLRPDRTSSDATPLVNLDPASTRVNDPRRTVDPTEVTLILPDSRLEAGNSLVDSSVEADPAVMVEPIDTGSAALGMEVLRNGLLLSHDMG